MGTDAMIREFPDTGQRGGVCGSQWDNRREGHMERLEGSSYEVAEAELHHRRYLVSPVVLIIEGVHNGLFYSAEELEDFAWTWNGVPVTVGHPEVEGQSVSANSPEVFSNVGVGRIYRARYDADKRGVVGEIWVDVELASIVDPKVVSDLESRLPLEVSTGLYRILDETPGTWNGEPFTSAVSSIRPDHLALLPRSVGACSLADGCGVRNIENNEEKEGVMGEETVEAKKREKQSQSLIQKLQSYFERVMGVGFSTSEMSNEDIRGRLQTMVDELDRGGWYHFVKDVFSDRFIYCARITDPTEIQRSGGMGEKHYQRSYTIGEDDTIILGSDIVEVSEHREWVPVDMTTVNQARLLTVCKAVSSCQHRDGNCNHASGKPETVSEYLTQMPEGEVKQRWQAFEVAQTAQKSAMIEALLENPHNKFSRVVLSQKPVQELEDMVALVAGGPPSDYSGAAGSSFGYGSQQVQPLVFGSIFSEGGKNVV